MMKNNSLLDILIAILIILIAFLCSCNTTERAIRTLEKKHKLAEVCATKFPVKDSIGRGDTTYNPAKNVDYTNQIDSLKQAFDTQLEAFKKAQERHKNDTACANDIRSLQLQYESLLVSYNRLKEAYKPCLPDTMKIEVPHYIENTAKTAMLQAKIERMRQDSIRQSVAVETWKHKARKRGKIIWTAISIIVLVGAGWIFLKGKMGVINSIIKKIKS